MSAKPESIINALKQSNNKLAICNYDGYTSNAVSAEHSEVFRKNWFYSLLKVVLVLGGAQEALYARPGNYRLVLKNRKGFVKLAIQTGSPLVPVFSFGEIDIFDQPNNEPGTRIRAYQDFVKRWTGVAPAFFHGRGFSAKSFGLIPYRHPITTVIGAPIEVTKNPQPSREEVDEFHSKFVEAINKLFDDHKGKYVKNAETVKLIIE